MKKYNSNNKRKDKRRSNYPSPVQRLDDILVAEVRLSLQLGIPENTILKNYKITQGQLNYCKNKKLSFKDIYSNEEE